MLPSDYGPDPTAGARSTRVYLMRHGQSSYNAEGRFQGCCNEPGLTPAGIATAEAAAAYLAAANLQAVITSPLRRASHTAVRIYNRVWRSLSEGPRFMLDRQLREIELPLWEGMPLASVRQNFAKDYQIWKEQPHLFHMPEGRRPVAELFVRSRGFWPRLLKRFAGQNVVLVTHGGTGRALISTALGISEERFHSIQQSNGGINILDFPDNLLQQAILSEVNGTDYLGEKLPKLKDSKTGLRILLVPASGADSPQLRYAEDVLKTIRIAAAFGDSTVNREVALRFLRGGLNEGTPAGICTERPKTDIPTESLATLLWVVQETLLQQITADVLGLPASGRHRLAAVPFTFTVLHYPRPDKAPILQAMNLHDGARLTRERCA